MDELLRDTLSLNQIGVSIKEVFVGSPMYADDLVADNALSLIQTMINTVYEYSCDWRYKINPSKSSILVIGESVVSRAKNRELRHWSSGNLKINEAHAYSNRPLHQQCVCPGQMKEPLVEEVLSLLSTQWVLDSETSILTPS